MSSPRRERTWCVVRRAAFTLLEVLLALAITAVLMTAMGSVLLISTRAVDEEALAPRVIADASEVLDEIDADLKLAISFIEKTPNAVTFTVPDRDKDGAPETIRYAWTGAVDAGPQPLTMSYNGADPVVVAEDVHAFDLSFLERTITGTGGTDEGGNVEPELRVLFVVKRVDQLENAEILKEFLLESWGYTVTRIDDEDPPGVYDAQVPLHDVAYVSDHADEGKLDDKLTRASIGVVTEHRETTTYLDLSLNKFDNFSTASIVIDDSSHYITRPFFPGLLPVLSDTDPLIFADDLLAPGAVALASEPGRPERPALVTFETGAKLYSGALAPARRVVMPWGDRIDFGLLNSEGRLLLKRALQWAAEEEVADVMDSPLFAQFEDPGVPDEDFTVKSSDWAVASIVPNLPPDAIGWEVTRFRFLAKQKGDPVQTLVIQVRGREPSGEPTGQILAQMFLDEATLPVEYGWVEVELEMTEPLPASQGACIAIGMLGGTDGAVVLIEDGNGAATPANQFFEGKPGAWDELDPDEDIPCEVHGTVRTPES